ncbi:MAG: methyltransferase domain-containing protein [Phycisphaeraceae bacterium]|nr:methyltransferase domain-containing protein [Phycisphaerales bacterium]MCB9861693.1 methyltransferase domain-containing protein [Phycisphaeraceae bacterium]
MEQIEQAKPYNPHSYRAFLKEFLAHPRSTAAIAPSSRKLARRMVEGIDFSKISSMIEFGPGTGVFTSQVARSIRETDGSHCRFIAIELNDRMAANLNTVMPDVDVRHNDARKVASICNDEGIEQVDYIISGLGWPSIPAQIRDEILEQTHAVLREGGQFRTFGYHIGLTLPGAWGFRKTVRKLFRTVEISPVIWGNLPPAFVYTCTK